MLSHQSAGREFMAKISAFIVVALVALAVTVISIKPSQFETRYVNNGQGYIAYQLSGDGEAIVLVHGFPSESYHWELLGIINSLNADFKILSYDVRGHGNSYKPVGKENYGIGLIDDIAFLLDKEGIDKATIVGHSMGGMIALKFASRYPERTRAVVSVGMGWMDDGEYSQRFFSIAPEAAYSDALKSCWFSLLEITLSEQEMVELGVPVKIIIGKDDGNYQQTIPPIKAIRPDINILEIPGWGHQGILWWDGLIEEITSFAKGH